MQFLSGSILKQNEENKEMYTILRLIYQTQHAFMFDNISQTVYKTHITKLIDRYNRFSQLMPQFDLTRFCQQWDIPKQQRKYLTRIKKEKQQKSNSDHALYKTSIQLQNVQSLLVGQYKKMSDLLPVLRQLNSLLKVCKEIMWIIFNDCNIIISIDALRKKQAHQALNELQQEKLRELINLIKRTIQSHAL